MTPRCVPLFDAHEGVGGKARGLGRLARAGFAVPPGFVVVDATLQSLPQDLLTHARALGPKVAVRSSAASEDGATQSFAGQLETLLDVATEGPHLEAAVLQCLRSASSGRVQAYAGHGVREGMAVVVQRMVAPRLAGVVFTVDPVSGRRGHLVIDAVRGLGEQLVGGEATPEHVVVSRRSDTVVRRDLVEAAPLLDDALSLRVAREALEIERSFGHPLDLEWALDADGVLHWLQARPITTLGADPDELDTPPPGPMDHYTRNNIGEMLPGVVTPLSLSVTAWGIDVGVQRMHVALGVADEQPGPTMVGVFSGQLFLDLTRIATIATHVAGASTERMCQALCGRSIPEVDPGPMQPWWARAWRALRYGWFLAQAPEREDLLWAMVQEQHWARLEDAQAQWTQLDRALPAMNTAYEHHVAGSALSGAIAPALLEIVAGGRPPTEADHARVGELIGDASGVESADIAGAAQRLSATIVKAGHGASFAGAPVDDAVEWLLRSGPAVVRREFSAYLERHGHRSVRELELRERPWAEAPEVLVRMLQASVRARLEHGERGAVKRPLKVSWGLRPLVTIARAAVRCREACKALLVKFATPFKAAYRHLGALLVRDGVLPDEDAVFFLTHQELGRAARGALPAKGTWAALALARRAVFEVQSATVFPSLFRGRPEPVSMESQAGEGTLVGRPVSPGIVEGRACVVRTLAEAAGLQPGDILVAPITDVGWTPYFSAIGGLVTDLGSAVSHGAVVAREVGLPCVVNTGVGTLTFRTGDVLRLDGTRGTVERVSRTA